MNRNDISRLIELFLDGATSPAQEQQLYSFFSSTADAGEFEPYRAMFDWYASLPQASPAPAKASRRRWWSAAGIAAAVAVAVATGFHVFSPRHDIDSDLYAMYKGSYVKINGKYETDISRIYPSLLKAEATADSLEHLEEPDAMKLEEAIVTEMLQGIDDPQLAAQLKAEILGNS